MAIAHVGSLAGSGNFTTGGTITLNFATAANDVIFVVATNGGANSGLAIAGTIVSTGGVSFAVLGGYDGGVTTTMQGVVWWARCTGNHTGQTVVISGATDSSAAAVCVLSGAALDGNPFESVQHDLLASGTNTLAAASATLANSWAMLALCCDDNIASAAEAATNPATVTERAEHTSGGGNDTAATICAAAMGAAGSTGAFSWTNTRGAGIYMIPVAWVVRPRVDATASAVAQARTATIPAASATGTSPDGTASAIAVAATSARGTATATGDASTTAPVVAATSARGVPTATGDAVVTVPAVAATSSRGVPTATGDAVGTAVVVSGIATIPAASGTGTSVPDPPNASVSVAGDTATLTWDASPTGGVNAYSIFRRTPSTGDPFDPGVDTPIATAVTLLTYDDPGLAVGDYDWQVFGTDDGAWSPAALSPFAWYDASDTASITDAGGGAVSAWNDKSGNGRHLTQSNGASRPVTGLHTLNGHNVIYAGTNKEIVTGALTLNQPYTVLVVMKRVTVDGSVRVFVAGSGFLLLTRPDSWRISAGSEVDTGVGSRDGAAHQFAIEVNGASSKSWLDAWQMQNNVNLGSASNASLQVGSTSASAEADIAEVVFVPGTLTADDRAAWNAYVYAKWGVWSPPLLPTLVAWYDASELASITQVGGAVSQWNDLSGNGYHLTQPTGGLQPTSGANTLNGLNVLTFGGKWMENTALSQAQPFTWIWVVTHDGGGSFPTLLDEKSGGAGLALIQGNGAGKYAVYYGSAYIGNTAMSAGEKLFVAEGNGGSSAITVNGTRTTGNAGSNAQSGVTLGTDNGHSGSSNVYWGGTVAEGFLFSGCDADDIAAAVAYMQAKWWTPLMLPNLVAWYDASDLASITQVGGAVSQWNDKSGNGYHLTQPTGALQPITNTDTINGKNVIKFANQVVQNASVSVNQPCTVLFVAKWSSLPNAADNEVIGYIAPNTSAVGVIGATNKWGYYAGGSNIASGTAIDTNTHQMVTILDGSNTKMHLDGTDLSVSTAGSTLGVQQLLVGAQSNGLHAFTGDVAEVVVLSSAITLGDLAAWNAYCTTKWGTP